MAEFPVSRISLENRIRRLLEDASITTTLSNSIDDVVDQLALGDETEIEEGTRLEIGEELLLVRSITPIMVQRGYNGTTPANHNSGDVVRRDPRYLKVNIVEAINVVLNDWISIYMPRFEWVTSGTFQSTTFIYPVPAEAIDVRRVAWKVPGFVDMQDCSHGQIQSYPTSIVSTGRGVPIFPWDNHGNIFWGGTCHVLLETPWDTLDTDISEVESDFPPQADELIAKGAVLYLLGWRLLPRVNLDETVFSREFNQSAPANSNIQWVDALKREWIDGVKRVANQRAVAASPQKIYIV